MDDNRITFRESVSIKDVSRGKAAVIAGIALIFMTILGPVANFTVVQGLLVPDDATKTAGNVIASESTFRIGILCFLAVAVLDVIVAWALYVILKPVNKSLSLLTAWFRVVYAAMLAALLVYPVHVLQIVGGPGYLSVFEPAQINSMALISLNDFSTGWQVALIIFGIHLLMLGYLFIKSGYVRNYLGILLIIAGLGYMTDGTGKILSPDYHAVVAVYTFLGEVVLVFWLLIKGRKIDTTV
jgi:hypothetical protein